MINSKSKLDFSSYKDTVPSFFAAANTGKGFTDRFKEIFDRPEIKRIYILKGGPGAGKSTLMKKAASEAAKSGLHPEIYYCSSDPTSLDGVIVKETGYAILDGTSPHIFDPVYPGTRDIVVNLGEAWNLKKLSESADKIKELTELKSNCYKSAYRFLSAASKAEDELCNLGEKCIVKAKASAAAARFADKYICRCDRNTTNQSYDNKNNSHIYNAISCKGAVRLFTPEMNAENLFFIKDVKSSTRYFMNKLCELAAKRGVYTETGVNPLNPDVVLSIFIPCNRSCISLYDDAYCEHLEKCGIQYKVINLGRFFDTDKYKALKNKYRFTEKCRDTLISGAYTELAKAGEYHAELESIYGKATDYGLISEISDKIVKSAIRT